MYYFVYLKCIPISPGEPYILGTTGANLHFFNSLLRYVFDTVNAQSLSKLLFVFISLASTNASSSSSFSSAIILFKCRDPCA